MLMILLMIMMIMTIMMMARTIMMRKTIIMCMIKIEKGNDMTHHAGKGAIESHQEAPFSIADAMPQELNNDVALAIVILMDALLKKKTTVIWDLPSPTRCHRMLLYYRSLF